MIGLRRALWAVAGAGLLLLAVQIDLIATSDFAPDRGLWVALDVVIGGGFVAVGLFAWSRRPDSRVGALMVVTGFAWFLSVFNLTEPALLFSVGLVLSNFYIAPAIHLLLGFPSGRLGTRVDRWLVGITYAAVTIGFLPIALTFDPSTEGCNCPENVFLADSHPSFARTWFDVLDVIGVIVLLAVLGRLVSRWRRATPPMRRVVTPLFAAGAVLMAMLAVLLGADLLRIEVSKDAYYLALIPFGLVPYLFLGSLAQARMLRGGAVGELVAGIGATLAGRELRDALARALNDPSLELAFWLPESGVYVDPEGQPLQLPQSERRATSDVTLDGRRVAVLIHDPLLLEEPELIEAVGATAALALEKDRLEAELRAKIGELRESRARMVSFGLAERRRLERDLHDGAQQRLVSLALDLRLARDAVRGSSRWRSTCGSRATRSAATRSAPRSSSTAPPRSSSGRWASCGSWRAEFTRPCSPIAASTRRSPRSPTVRRFPSRWSAGWASASRNRSSWPLTSWSPRRSRTLSSTRTPTRRPCGSSARTGASWSRSPTTGSAAPIPAAAPACAGSPTGSRPSADASRWTRGPRVGRW